MSVTALGTPDIQRAWYNFDTIEEAVLFIHGVKDELIENEYFQYVDSDVEPNDEPVGGWRGRVDYIDRTPPKDQVA